LLGVGTSPLLPRTQLVDTGDSILAIGVLHASFNAAGQMSAVPGGWQHVPAMIMLTLAVIAYRRWRGRSFTRGFAPALVADPTTIRSVDQPVVSSGQTQRNGLESTGDR
jgi:hypothetical protein